MEQSSPKVKTILTNYVIKVNGEPAHMKPSLREARQLIKDMPVHDTTLMVSIVKQTVTETILDTYEPKVTKVLMASDLGLDDE